MTTTIPWNKTLGAKLGAVALLLLILFLIMMVTNYLVLTSLRASINWINHAGKGRKSAYQMLYLANRLPHEDAVRRELLSKELRDETQTLEERYQVLSHGDSRQEISAATDQRILEVLRSLQSRFQDKIKPRVEAIMKASSDAAAEKDLVILDQSLREQSEEANQIVVIAMEDTNRSIQQALLSQYLIIPLVLFILGIVLWIGRDIVLRARSLAQTADRIANGDLNASVTVMSSDELAALGTSFNTMTKNLQKTIETEKSGRSRIQALLENIREATGQLTSASAEILAGTTQQAAGAQEQASAVSQTVITVDEVAQTTEQAVQRAKNVGESVQRTVEIGKAGRKIVDDSLGAMEAVKEKVEGTAENILMLAEQAQAISVIITAVNDIAEQTNLLALNAAIEASRAGEHGRGFTVVAGEVKALADQSKKATAQVRHILGEIQKATNTAVLSTEDVSRGVEAAIKVGGHAGETIKTLTDTLTETSQAVKQIAASAGQQSVGMHQINLAMKNIDQVAKQNAVATQQAAQAAMNLNQLGTRLSHLTTE